MADGNLIDFYDRLQRIENLRAHGGAFEATGTIGAAPLPVRQLRRGRSILLAPLVIMALTITGLKVAIHMYVGHSAYEHRVEELRGADGFGPVGAMLMQADPVTVFISDELRKAYKH